MDSDIGNRHLACTGRTSTHLAKSFWAGIFLLALAGNFLLFASANSTQAAPVITTQPEAMVYDEPGKVVTLSLEATGQAPFSVEWFSDFPRLNGQTGIVETIPGGIRASLTPPYLLNGFQMGAVVRDATGSVTSRVSSIYVPQRYFARVAAWPEMSEAISAVQLAGRRAWVYSGSLHSFDIFNPASPLEVSSPDLGADIPRAAKQIQVAPPYAFVSHFGYISLFSIADPARLSLIAGIGIEQGASGRFAFQDGFLYVPSGSAIEVFNVQDPQGIRTVARLPSRSATDVIVRDKDAWVADYDGVILLDVSTPAAPKIKRRVSGTAALLALDGNQLYFARESLLVMNIENPGVVRNIRVSPPGGSVQFLQVRDGVAYISGPAGYIIADVRDPEAPRVLFSDKTATLLSVEFPWAATAVQGGIQLLDISDPASPLRLSTIEQPPLIAEFKYSGGLVFAAAGNSGLIVLDMTDPTSPKKIGQLTFPEPVTWIDVSKQTAALVCGGTMLRIVDLSDPLHPRETGTLGPLPHGWGVAMNNAGVALWIRGNGYADIIDLRDPAHPARVGTLPKPCDQALGFNNLFAQIGGPVPALQLIQIDDPAKPVYLGRYTFPDSNHRALSAIEDNIAFVAGHGVQLFDLSNPLEITPLTPIIPAASQGLAGDLFMGKTVLDLTNSRQPAYAGTFGTTDTMWDTVRLGEYVLARNWNRLVVIRAPDGKPVFESPGFTIEVTPTRNFPPAPWVEARSAWPVTYQWYYGASGTTNYPVPGQTSARLNWTLDLQTNRLQTFWVRATNVKGFADGPAFAVQLEPDFRVQVTGEKIVFELSALRGGSWLLESSADLITWSPDRDLAAPPDGSVTRAEITVPRSGHRFYRVKI